MTNKKIFTAMLIGMGVYCLIALGVFVFNFAAGEFPFTFGLSISVNVSHAWWSTIVYFLGNCFVSYCVSGFYRVKKLPLVYRIGGYFVIAALMLISMCPIGLISGTLDNIHNVLARVLLISMMVHTLIGALCFIGERGCRLPNILFLLIDAGMIVNVIFFSRIFFSYIFLSEFILIITYFLSLIVTAKHVLCRPE